MPTDFIGLFALLSAARIRFVLVGGLALVLHGLDRLTAAGRPQDLADIERLRAKLEA